MKQTLSNFIRPQRQLPIVKTNLFNFEARIQYAVCISFYAAEIFLEINRDIY